MNKDEANEFAANSREAIAAQEAAHKKVVGPQEARSAPRKSAGSYSPEGPVPLTRPELHSRASPWVRRFSRWPQL